MAFASSQHSVWVPRTTIPRGQDRTISLFVTCSWKSHDIPSIVVTGSPRFRIRGHRTSQWEPSVAHCKRNMWDERCWRFIILKHHFNPVFPLLTKTNSGTKSPLHFGLKHLSFFTSCIISSIQIRRNYSVTHTCQTHSSFVLFSTNPSSFDLRNSTSDLKVTVHWILQNELRWQAGALRDAIRYTTWGCFQSTTCVWLFAILPWFTCLCAWKAEMIGETPKCNFQAISLSKPTSPNYFATNMKRTEFLPNGLLFGRDWADDFIWTQI